MLPALGNCAAEETRYLVLFFDILFHPSLGQERDVEANFLHGSETPTVWTNTRGLVMAVAYGEQQATKKVRNDQLVA